MEKTITLQIEELKNTFIDAINSSNLPVAVLDYIVKDIYYEIHLAGQKQLAADKKIYIECTESRGDKTESAS